PHLPYRAAMGNILPTYLASGRRRNPKTSRLEEYEEILYTMRATVAGFPVLWWMFPHPFQRRVDVCRHLRGSVVILFICFYDSLVLPLTFLDGILSHVFGFGNVLQYIL
ncbi:MAG: hypothetical protein FWC77_08410, partial [Defluviitaleaceae bacterium]|nr:hypothetical protein [Defluviitaleaceae bacterium]